MEKKDKPKFGQENYEKFEDSWKAFLAYYPYYRDDEELKEQMRDDWIDQRYKKGRRKPR